MQADADVLQERQRLKDEWQAYMDRRREYIKLLEGFKWVQGLRKASPCSCLTRAALA